MERLKPFLGRYLQAPKVRYIMDFEEFFTVELVLKDIKSDITDLSDLVDEKKGKMHIIQKEDFVRRKSRVRQAGKIAAYRASGFDNKFIGSTGFDNKFLG